MALCLLQNDLLLLGTPLVCVDRICGMVFNSVTTAAGSSSVPVNSKYEYETKACNMQYFGSIVLHDIVLKLNQDITI